MKTRRIQLCMIPTQPRLLKIPLPYQRKNLQKSKNAYDASKAQKGDLINLLLMVIISNWDIISQLNL